MTITMFTKLYDLYEYDGYHNYHPDHDRHDDLYEGNHDCCVSIQSDDDHDHLSFDFIGFYEGQEIPFTNLELFAPSSVLVSKVLRNYFQDYFPKTIENFSVCPLSGGFFFLCKHSFS